MKRLIILLLALTLVAASPPPATPACNRPASDMPPAPDGCPDWAPVAPPPAPIPPPCVKLQTRWSYWDIGTAVSLRIYIDHPELSAGARTYTKLSKLLRPGEVWELVDADWEVSCGKDEGPLTWALLEILNNHNWDALDVYTTSPFGPGYMLDLRLLSIADETLTQLVAPPAALQVTWSPPDRLTTDIYPNGEWQLTPDCYDRPESCWNIVGARWWFRLARDGASDWYLDDWGGDYEPPETGTEKYLLYVTLQVLEGADARLFGIFEPAFDACYVDLVAGIGRGEQPAAATYPLAGPNSRCPWEREASSGMEFFLPLIATTP